MKRAAVTCRVAAAALFVLTGAGSAPPSLPQDLASHAATVGADQFAFTATTRVEPSGDAAKIETRVESYDPSRPADSRWLLVSIDGRAPTEKERRQAVKARASGIVPSYSRLALYIGKPTTSAEAEAGRSILSFDRMPVGVVVVGRKDISSDIRARAFVDRSPPQPWVDRVDFETVRPVSMMMVAKIQSMKFSSRFKLLAEGRPVPAEQISTVTGSMLGRSGTIKTTVLFSDHRALR